MSSHDQQFFDKFLLITGILVSVTVGLFILGGAIAANTQTVYATEDLAYQTQIETRIRPFGQVALIGDKTITTTESAVAIKPVAEVMSGPQVYNAACFACHGAGIGGAPKPGNVAAWSDRIGQGADILGDHAINGYQGNAGYMPPKGGRTDLSDEEILAAVDYMVSESR